VLYIAGALLLTPHTRPLAYGDPELWHFSLKILQSNFRVEVLCNE